MAIVIKTIAQPIDEFFIGCYFSFNNAGPVSTGSYFFNLTNVNIFIFPSTYVMHNKKGPQNCRPF
jgi:hypothetical protein